LVGASLAIIIIKRKIHWPEADTLFYCVKASLTHPKSLGQLYAGLDDVAEPGDEQRSAVDLVPEVGDVVEAHRVRRRNCSVHRGRSFAGGPRIYRRIHLGAVDLKPLFLVVS